MRTESRLDLGMNTTYEQAHSWAADWKDEYHPELERFTRGIWLNDFVEYSLRENDFGVPYFKKESIEIRNELIFQFIVPATKEEFFTVLSVIDQ
jgi:hypothetical protein